MLSEKTWLSSPRVNYLIKAIHQSKLYIKLFFIVKIRWSWCGGVGECFLVISRRCASPGLVPLVLARPIRARQTQSRLNLIASFNKLKKVEKLEPPSLSICQLKRFGLIFDKKTRNKHLHRHNKYTSYSQFML